jgi:GDPmannose 4,6-dehydratase
MATALITGIAGQDGSYLAELLLEKGYRVVGTTRGSAGSTRERISHIAERVDVVRCDVHDSAALAQLLSRSQPDEIYNLASQSSVALSWADPIGSAESSALALTRLLEAVRSQAPHARVFQAGSSEIFSGEEYPQRETTPIAPSNPYGAAKAYAHFVTKCYRESHGLFAASGILFNHESPRRSPQFVFRKVSLGVARIHRGLATELRMGNLDVRRDWGFAGDFVDAMWRTLQKDTPGDYVVGTGEAHSVRDLVDTAFRVVGLDYHDHVVFDEQFRRPGDANTLVADIVKARVELGWQPTMTFETLVTTMVEHDLEHVGA